jgi:hypothetical protein
VDPRPELNPVKLEHWFNPSVPVRDVNNVGHTIYVSNVPKAAEILLTWDKRGPKWRKAVQVCMEAMEGKKSADEVRKAFESAAKEAGVLRGE